MSGGSGGRCVAWRMQLERADLASEIIISEWNPPKDSPLLIETLDIPAGLRHVTVAGVITGAEHHRHFLGADEVGIHVTEAANVGLRRARGEFIVGKSSDTFYSPEVIEKIAARDLRKDTIYRVDRHDVFIDDPARVGPAGRGVCWRSSRRCRATSMAGSSKCPNGACASSTPMRAATSR